MHCCGVADKMSFSSIRAFFVRGQDRSVKIKKNVVGLILLKGVSVAVSFLIVPLTLSYLEPAKYGIWLTLSSIIGWFGLFDIGLGNGLRNKLGEALAKKDHTLARSLVSTTMGMLIGIMIIVSVLFGLINPFINWITILNVPLSMKIEINRLVIIVFSFFVLRFVFGLISTVLATDQRPALADSLNTLTALFSLAAIYVLTLFTKNSLLYMGAALSSITTLVLFFASLWFFCRDYRFMAPSPRYFDRLQIRNLTSQGMQFFGIQIAALLLFMTSNVIITQLFGPEEVVPYNIAFKLFSCVVVAFGILLTPFWAAHNEAYNQQDVQWIKRAIRKMLGLWGLSAIGVILLFLFSGFIYHLWIGEQIIIPMSMSFFMGLYVVVHTFNMIFVTFIFATGKLRIQTYLAIFGGIIIIPLSIFLAKTIGLGPSGVILATTLCGATNMFFGPMQYHKIMNNTAHGIWAR